MKRMLPLLMLSLITMFFPGCQDSRSSNNTDALRIRILTYNVLRPEWGREHYPDWNTRQIAVIKLIQDMQVDFIGLQEESDYQLQDILAANPSLRPIGDRPSIGGSILYRHDRWAITDYNVLRAPERDPDHRIKYMRPLPVAHFSEIASGKRVTVFNVHLTPFSAWARNQAIETISDYAASHDKPGSIFIIGDFNATESSPELVALHSRLNGQLKSAWADHNNQSRDARIEAANLASTTYDRIRAHRSGETPVPPETLADLNRTYDSHRHWGTMHGFSGQTWAYKIDYLFVPMESQVVEASILDRKYNDVYGSDHHAIFAEVLIPPLP